MRTDFDRGHAEFVRDLARLRHVFRRIHDAHGEAFHHGLGVLRPIDLPQLRKRLHHQKQPHVVTRKVRDALGENRDAPDGGGFIQDERDLIDQCRVVLRQFLRLKIQSLFDEEIEERL